MDKIQRGHAAQALLDNELLKECFVTLSDNYTQAWFDGRTVDVREDCHRYVQLIAKLKQDLTSIATTGAFERKRLDELEGKRKIPWPIMISR